MIDLVAGPAKLTLAPDLGGGIAGLWFDDRPVLRPWSGNVGDGPFALASNVLVPFSNRIENGFTFDSVHYPMAPNLEGDPFAIHGDGFEKPWQPVSQGADKVRLRFGEGEVGPFRYEAEQSFSLTETGMQVSLTMVNRASIPLPYGGGFHPWFPRDENTRLQVNVLGHWPEDDRHLPTTRSPQDVPEAYDFSQSMPLPGSWINAGFSQWDGTARIDQGESAVPVVLISTTLTTAIIFSPDSDCGFFCFEPVSHPVNAHNLPGLPGLVVLQPGESYSLDMALRWALNEPETRNGV